MWEACSPIIPELAVLTTFCFCKCSSLYSACPSTTSSPWLPICSPFKIQPNHLFLWETLPTSLRLGFIYFFIIISPTSCTLPRPKPLFSRCLSKEQINEWIDGWISVPLKLAFLGFRVMNVKSRGYIWALIPEALGILMCTVLTKVIENGYLLQAKLSLRVASELCYVQKGSALH